MRATRLTVKLGRMLYASELGNTEFIETGLFTDKISGGIPKGKIVILSGQWSVGKSTLAFQMIEAAQKQGLKCLFADVEFSYDSKYATTLGVNNSKLGIIRERTAEEVLDALEKEIDSDKWDLVVIDSMGALSSRVEVEKAAGEKTIGAQAGLVARFIRKVVPVLATNGCTLLCLTHEFTDIMTGKIMASGGAKLGYHASQHIRLKVKYGVSLKQGENVVGKVITAEMKKDKLLGNEKKECDGQLIFGSGFSKQADIWEEAVRKGLTVKQGNTWFLGEEKLGTIGKVREWLKVPENAEKLKSLIANV